MILKNKINELNLSKITLGTAQLGSKYGIANFSGIPNPELIRKIMFSALNLGITSFDTAPGYGNSEKILGDFIQNQLKNIVIITKIPKIEFSGNDNDDYSKIKQSIISSKDRLGLSKIPVCLLHHAPDMDYKNGIIVEHLQKLKNEQHVDLVGVSTYTLDEVQRFLEIEEFDVIEIPLNIFDNKLLKNGILQKLAEKQKIILARSIYLQGLFFLDPDRLPPSMKLAKMPLEKLNNISLEFGRSIQELAFLFVRDVPEISSLIIGVETDIQLKKNIELLNSPPLSDDIKKEILREFDNLPEALINPSMWNKDDNK